MPTLTQAQATMLAILALTGLGGLIYLGIRDPQVDLRDPDGTVRDYLRSKAIYSPALFDGGCPGDFAIERGFAGRDDFGARVEGVVCCSAERCEVRR